MEKKENPPGFGKDRSKDQRSKEKKVEEMNKKLEWT